MDLARLLELNAFIDVITVFPHELIITWAFVKFLRMERPWTFGVLRMVVTMALTVFRSVGGVPLRLFMLLVTGILLPFVFSRESIPRRLLVIFAVIFLPFLPEIASYGVWYGLTGLPVYDYDAVRAHFGAHMVMSAFSLLLYYLCYVFLRRVFKSWVGQRDDRFSYTLVGFAALQCVLVSLVMWSKLAFFPEASQLDALAAVFCALSFAVDIVLIVSFDRLSQRSAEEAKADAAQRKFDECLVAYSQATESAGRAARMRHDLRNQLQTVQVLLQRGQREEAQEHLGHMIAGVEGGEDVSANVALPACAVELQGGEA